LRGRKSAGEVALIRQAIDITEEMFANLSAHMRLGRSEQDIAAILQDGMARSGVTPAWDPASCPVVNAGANLDSGHAGPTEKQIEPGQIVHLDFGVQKAGFCSDLQRLWYVRREGERQAPPGVLRAFDTVRKAIEAGSAALAPGAAGWAVDEAGRRVVVEAGYPEFQHALGHQLGRTAHDGSTILGPRWERYGNTPFGEVEQGNVFTLELGVNTGAGMVALEEDVLVTAHGCEYLSKPQTELWYV
jgi:Xaa-Pro aminopeptidase